MSFKYRYLHKCRIQINLPEFMFPNFKFRIYLEGKNETVDCLRDQNNSRNLERVTKYD